MRITIGKKLIVGYLLVVLLMTTLTLYALRVSQTFLRESVGRQSIFLAEEMLKRINYNLQHTIEHIQLHTRQALVHEKISESNRTFQERENIEDYLADQDAAWIDTPKNDTTPVMRALIHNELSEELRADFIQFWQKKRGYQLYQEIIVTNRYGANVAQTGRTTDCNQADERWWQKARDQEYYIGDVEYDESTQAFVLPLGIRIDDEHRRFIGVMKAAISITALIREAEVSTRTYQTSEIQIVSARTQRLLYATKAFQPLEDVSEKPFFNKLQGERGFFLDREGRRIQLFSYAHVTDFGRYAALDWILIVSHDEREVLAPLVILRNHMLLIAGLLTAMGLVSVFVTSRSITKPIRTLIAGTEMIGKGNLDHRVAIRSQDEIGTLAAAFNRMTERRQKTGEQLRASEEGLRQHRDHLEKIIADRTAELKATNEELEDEIVERRQTERQLRESEQQMFQFLEAMPVGVFVLDAHGTPYYANQKATELLGRGIIPEAEPETLSEIYQTCLSGTTHAYPAEKMPIVRALRGERSTIDDMEIHHPDRTIPVQVWGAPVSDLDGTTTYAVAAFGDITDRKRAEDLLHRQAAITNVLLNSPQETVALLDTEGKVLNMNLNGAQKFGLSPREIIGRNIYDFIPEPVCSARKKIIREVMRTGQPVHFEDQRGHMHFMNSIYPVNDPESGDLLGTTIFAVDITQRKRAEEALKRQHQQLLALLDGIDDVIYVADPETYELLHVNDKFTRYWGSEAIGKLCYKVLQDRETPCPFCSNKHIWGENLGQVYVWEFQNEITKRWFRCADKAIRWMDDRWVRFEQATDITDRKQAEMELERLNSALAQKNAELEQIIYVTSHDLRSPLVNAQGFSQELKYTVQELCELLEGCEIPPEHCERLSELMHDELREDLDYILASIAKMDRLLSGLLKLSRLGRAALTIEALDMNNLLRQVVSIFEFHIQNAGVNVDIAPLPPCEGDDTQINQVFSNLLGNALKYLDPGRPGRIRVWGREEEDRSVYCVEDNGIGIAPEHQPRIFEIFHRLDPEQSDGEGLGLTIVSRAIERQGGKIWVESTLGQGSRFFVSLPTGEEKE